MTEEAAPKKAQINYGAAGGTVPPTSGETKPEREPVKRIIDSSEIKRKKSLGRKLKENFGGDDIRSVIGYVATDVLLPKAKDAIFDGGAEFLHRMVFGSARNPNMPNSDRSRGTNYNRMYVSPNKGYASPAPQAQPQASTLIGPNDYMDFIFPDRGRAEETLDQMLELVSHYGTVSVHELKAMLGITGEFTDQKWGWKALGNASVERERDGYRLALPKVVSLD
ncbi:hypothetical protein SEA_SLOOPYJOE_49 [Arthrobacter phage Sloopyjoe]|nr:hypothetical protein PBI_STAYER_49 [Arthrobacter phage Stayer]QFG09757.1 hypothetical protein PBI_SHIBA_48 [Arthrobacter phage Shiba]QFG10193.1 hypothetical protein PBI_EGAD_49 [Arthrobacter phage Egad]QFG11763.1 hypothetical protein PBI_SALK_49 [Arthrobacter phage Salk]QFG14419.1 hypothetical protein PBI_STARLORD_49 [Arthrobacter phage StarLord]UVT31127.1 hypothetical protein PBI_LINDA_49 [Arthrobacter phage Linda]WAB09465.1 hypothetical protein SEA_SLOOPYJOE_49 [Arthrobacter phage Sloopy